MRWKKIKDNPDYEVSDFGIVRKGKIIIGQWINDQGYALVRLSNPRRVVRVHRLVGECFVSNPYNRPLINHIDFIRSNNHYKNLEWCTQWENLMHSQKNGRMQRDYWKGKRSPNAKLSEKDVLLIRDEYSMGGISWDALGKKYNVSKRTIGRIIKNEHYT